MVPKEYVADLFPELRPRQFSIASSSSVSNASSSMNAFMKIDYLGPSEGDSSLRGHCKLPDETSYPPQGRMYFMVGSARIRDDTERRPQRGNNASS
jgi:hypothetical protein